MAARTVSGSRLSGQGMSAAAAGAAGSSATSAISAAAARSRTDRRGRALRAGFVRAATTGLTRVPPLGVLDYPPVNRPGRDEDSCTADNRSNCDRFAPFRHGPVSRPETVVAGPHRCYTGTARPRKAGPATMGHDDGERRHQHRAPAARRQPGPGARGRRRAHAGRAALDGPALRGLGRAQRRRRA